MQWNVYGEAGKPVLVFPTRGGRYYHYESFGMVKASRSFIDKGGIRLFAVAVDKPKLDRMGRGEGALLEKYDFPPTTLSSTLVGWPGITLVSTGNTLRLSGTERPSVAQCPAEG